MSNKPLSAKQRTFVAEYLKDKNATQAAIRAGYSEKTANPQAARLLAKASVKAAVDEQLKAQEARTLVTADTVLKELLRLATVDISQAYDSAGWLKRLDEIPEDVRRAISHLETAELFQGEGDQKHIIGVTKKVKFHDKNKALELLGKHLKLFTDRIQLDAGEGFAELMRKAEERKAQG